MQTYSHFFHEFFCSFNGDVWNLGGLQSRGNPLLLACKEDVNLLGLGEELLEADGAL